MHIEILREFKIVAVLKDLDEASKTLYIPKTNIIRHLRDLETEIGIKLFGGNKYTVLTPAGRMYFQVVSECLSNLDQGLDKVQEERKLKRNELTLHAPDQQELTCIIFKAVRKLHEYDPLAAVQFVSLYRKSPIAAVETNFVDVAVNFRYGNEESLIEEYSSMGIRALPIKRSKLALWLRKTHRIARVGICEASDLERITIVSEAIRHDPMRIVAESFCAAHNVSPRFKVGTSNNTQDLFLKCDEIDCALLVSEGLKDHKINHEVFPDFTVVPFKDPDAFVTSFLIANSKANKDVVDMFFNCMSECL